jgi:hypothetical protein
VCARPPKAGQRGSGKVGGDLHVGSADVGDSTDRSISRQPEQLRGNVTHIDGLQTDVGSRHHGQATLGAKSE